MSNNRGSYGGSGIGIGAVIAIVLSWTTNQSVLYAVLHALCGWFYVAYWLFTHGPWK